MPKLSSQELQDWYKRFSQAVYEKANIDVTRVEDIGRIKNFYYVEKPEDDPMAGLCYFYFPFMARSGKEYVNPAPVTDDFQAYSSWMMQNLNPKVDDEKIQELYDMSQAGTLMVNAPGLGVAYMQQVYTNADGQISVSRPLAAYERIDESNGDNVHFDPIPEGEDRPPKISERTVPEPNPAAFNLTDAPAKQEKPGNMHPGFLSWLGYLLGMDTEYAKLVRYQKWNEWFNNLDRSSPDVNRYLQAVAKREEYLQQRDAFLAHPIGQATLYAHGTTAYMGRQMFNTEDAERGSLVEREIKESIFLAQRHLMTPQGHLLKSLQDNTALMMGWKRTNLLVRDMMGLEPHGTRLGEWHNKKVLNIMSISFAKQKLPVDPERSQKTKDERFAYDKKWTNLAELANFCALSDPTITGTSPLGGCTPEETAKLTFKKILSDLFTVGNPHSQGLVKFLELARIKGAGDLEACHSGNPQPLAESLARTLRHFNHEVAAMPLANSEHALNTLHLTDRLLNALQSNRDLLDASGLKQEELEEAKANVELYAVMRKGYEAKCALLEHSLYKKDLTPEQLQQAGLDVLFAESVVVGIRGEYSSHSEMIANTSEHKALMEEFKNTDITAESKATAGNRINLMDLNRPAFMTAKQLLNADWVAERKASLYSDSQLSTIAEMNRDDLGKLISSTSRDIFDGFAAAEMRQPDAKGKSVQEPEQPQPAPMQPNLA